MITEHLRHRLQSLCRINILLALLTALFHFIALSAEAAPRRSTYDEDQTVIIRELRDGLDELRHEIQNHETEIRMFEERANNQESTIASLRQQVLDTNQANKELVKGNATTVEGRIAGLESANKGLIADLQKFKTHANDSSAALAQYKERIAELEKMIALQNQNIDNLQGAVRSLTDALQVQYKDTSTILNDSGTGGSSGKTYRVQAGDSLEKIARVNGTTIKALKEVNNLNNDRIVVGQKLQLP